ncbi:restriction endonuclease subunit S [Clostridium perfringens]|nr:restriction endonuclease subunit S [Clostridium perfringens]MBI6093360.1 restriction endonuclease subunit S [Clostridium perfringens]
MKVNKLGDIACFSQGIQVAIDKQYNKIEEGYVRFLRIIDYTQNKDEIRYIDNPGERYLVNNNDVVMIRYGDAGKVVKGYEGAIANNLFKICIDEKLIIREYLYYYLSQENIYKQLTNSQQKTGLPAVNFKTVSEIKIVYPESIAIQKNIVKILDKAQELIDKRKEQIGELDKLIKSKFIEMFGDQNTNSKNLEKVYLKDISELITKGASPNWQGIEYVDDDTQTLFVTSENVREGYIDLSKKKYLMDAFNEKQKRSILNNGDFLINIVGASIGRAAQFNLDIKANINQAVALVRIKKGLVNDKYMLEYLNSPKALQMYKSMQVSVARANLSLQNINDLEILLPPMELQNQFANFVKQVDKLKFILHLV